MKAKNKTVKRSIKTKTPHTDVPVDKPSFLTKILAIILISSLGIIAYSNSFHCPFHFDDDTSIVHNAAIINLHNLQNIWDFWPCRFITYLSLAFNYHFDGLNVFGYHLFNLAVHLVSAILVWWLVLLTLSTPAMRGNKITSHSGLIALLAGLVFVSHPIQTQAVVYIVQRATSMAALFYLACLCFYVKARLHFMGPRPGLKDGLYYICSLLAAIAAMFTKELTITLPLMILLYEFSFLKTGKRTNGTCLIPFLLTLGIIPLTMLWTKSVDFHEMHRAVEYSPGITSTQYLLTQFRVLVTYIRLIFLPLNQNVDYDYPVSNSLFEFPTLVSFLFLIINLLCAVRLFSKYRLVSFSIFWFYLTLLPESSVIPIKDVIFEHRLYLPLAGYSLFLVSALYYLLSRVDAIKNVPAIMVVVLTLLISCNAVLTYQRNKIWGDEFGLWNDIVRKSPHKARPYNNRGFYFTTNGKYAQAISDYTKAIEIDPQYPDAYNNRGLTYYREGKLTQAIADYSKAIEINPKFAETYYNRGLSYDNQGKLALALSDYNKAIELNPHYADAYNNRSIIYSKQGNYSHIISDATKAIELNPSDARSYHNRGLSYDNQGNFTQALLDLNKAIELDPKFQEAYLDRGSVYYKINNLDSAISDFNKAIELKPNDAIAYNDRGLSYDKQCKFTEAIADYDKAIEINPKYTEGYYDRGLSYSSQKKFTQAVADYNKAIEIDPQYAKAYYNRAVFYYQLKEYDQAWADVNKAKALNVPINPQLIKLLKEASGR